MMININPLIRLLAEKDLTFSELSQLTNISLHDLSLMKNGKFITKENLDTLCRILNCQPCEIIEFTKNEDKGHWEWVANSEE